MKTNFHKEEEMTRIERMVADPELGGELLLIGTTMAAILDHGIAADLSIKRIHLMSYGPKGPKLRIDSDVRENVPTRNGRVKWKKCRTAELLRLDARRYEKPEARNIVCGAPTPRKPRCGKNVQMFGLFTDWTSGERFYLGSCSKHAEWFMEWEDAHQAARPEVGEVLPYANAGGVLARHFPEIDWPGIWRSLDPQWREYPERESIAPGSPKLELLLGDREPERPSVALRVEEPPKLRRNGQRTKQPRNRGIYAVPDPS